jgi:hypothetical protein
MKVHFKSIAGGAVVLLLSVVASCHSNDSPRPLPRSSDAAGALADSTVDALIAAQLAQALKIDPMTRDAEIQVAVAQGRARLSGFVQNAAAKLRAGELAQQASGIVAVENRLILRYHANLETGPLGDVRVRL